MITFDIEDLQYKGTLIIIDNDAQENVEQMFLQIEALPGPFPLAVEEETAMVTITDNDGREHIIFWCLFSKAIVFVSFQ